MMDFGTESIKVIWSIPGAPPRRRLTLAVINNEVYRLRGETPAEALEYYFHVFADGRLLSLDYKK